MDGDRCHWYLTYYSLRVFLVAVRFYLLDGAGHRRGCSSADADTLWAFIVAELGESLAEWLNVKRETMGRTARQISPKRI
jgi:hypothetical protein